jgi:uncharacterized flavoprotein (TIGR03862 family)
VSKKKIAIVGGGPAGLMAADVLSKHFQVHVYEKEKGVGQKFLVAGKGGFNVTNGLQGEALADVYTPREFMREALSGFGPEALRQWLMEMDIPTFVGSSGRIFPEKGITQAEVLSRWKERLSAAGVKFHLKYRFTGFDAEDKVLMTSARKQGPVEADYVIFGLGGASWPVTGSDGSWREAFQAAGIQTLPFRASNCGIEIDWPVSFRESHQGKPLKNIAIRVNDKRIRGEALITAYGLEGNAVYPVVPEIRRMLEAGETAVISLDLKPVNSPEQLAAKAEGKTSARTKNYASLFNLSTEQIALLKAYTDKETFLSPPLFAETLKNVSIPVQALRPVEEAISTVGGIALSELNPDFSLRKFPDYFAVGEMLDWDAPTGGFLLQGCFSSGHRAAETILERENFLPKS